MAVSAYKTAKEGASHDRMGTAAPAAPDEIADPEIADFAQTLTRQKIHSKRPAHGPVFFHISLSRMKTCLERGSFLSSRSSTWKRSMAFTMADSFEKP